MTEGAREIPPSYAIDLAVDAVSGSAALERHAMLASAWELSRQLSASNGVAASAIFDALTRVPDELLSLLETPEGWGALAYCVAADLGVPSSFFRPTIN